MRHKIYEYKNCSTCKKALKFLDAEKIEYEKISIVEQPPSRAELKMMLSYLKRTGGTLKNLFNTAGEQYRSLGISAKLNAGLSENDAIDLLARNGKLVKRPFFLMKNNGLVGFQEAAWKKLLS